MKFLRPVIVVANSISAHLLILLLLALVLFSVAFFLSVQLTNQQRIFPAIAQFTQRQLGSVESLYFLPEGTLKTQIEKFEKQFPGNRYLFLESEPEGLSWQRGGVSGKFSTGQFSHVEFARVIKPIGDGQHETSLYFRFPDKRIFVIEREIRTRPSKPKGRLFRIMDPIQLFLVVSLVLLLLWSWFALIRPLRSFSGSADAFAKGHTAPQPVPETGPTELKSAARALNGMQKRIHRLMEDRTRMLAAVGHDLRTPVTRLRLRADKISDETNRQAILGDIEQMETQLAHLMTYFRKGENGERKSALDLSSLLISLAEEWSDSSHDVSHQVSNRIVIEGKTGELTRMIDNLIANAVKYAGGCEVQLVEKDTLGCLSIIDHGPGIPDDEKDLMQQPFVRGDKARNMNEITGFGLGLAIAAEVAAGHDAELQLLDTPGGGLTILISFPLQRID